jgi:hypothetical protein
MAETTTTDRKGSAMAYNATAYKLEGDKVASVEAVEVVDGTVVRACGHQIPGLSGTPAFEAAWRRGFFSWVTGVEVVLDGATGYRNRLAGLALPPAYSASEREL